MEILWLLLAVISAAAAALISKITQTRRRPEGKLPPGPKAWPIIGNLNLLGSIPHQSLHNLSQKYGEIMLLKFGKFPVFVASSPKMAEQFLKVHDAVFASRPKFAVYRHLSFDYSDVGFSPYGPYWREGRKIFMTKVLSARKQESFKHIRVEERRRLLSSLRSLSGKPVQLRDHLTRLTLSTICKMIFKEEYFDSVVDMDHVREIVREFYVLAGAFNIGDWIPWLHSLDLQGYVKQVKALRKKMDTFCDSVIDHHLAKRVAGEDDDDKKDYVDVLLELAEDKDEVEFTRKSVKAFIINLLVSGADTSSGTLEWVIHEILKQEGTIEKAKAELNRVIGRDRWVEEKELIGLPYIDAIVMETLRLHPIATLLAPHCATEDCNVAGYDISNGTMVLINVWGMGRDPNLWDAPQQFLPERFLGKEMEMVTGSNFAFLPFGSGRRRCPGINFALNTVRTTLANLLHGFEMRLEEGMRPQDISMEEQYGLTTIPKYPLSIIMEPTLPDHLY